MKSRYDTAEAETYRQRYSPTWGPDLADRVYTSRLLGSDPSLVLHGGGNTSVKGRTRDVEGEPIPVLWVKGSGWDLASIEPPGFPACRLAPLRRYCHLPELSDEAMVGALRSQMLDPSAPNPSVEALLHAHLPGKFVDHTHADAALAIVDQPDARERAREVWGERALFLPYVMPGFVLAQRIVGLGIDESSPPLIVLEKHGVFTWGETARESYERMIEAVDAAERYLAARPGKPSPARGPARDARAEREARLRVGPLLRGALARVPGGRRMVLEWRHGAALEDFVRRDDAREVSARGCITPDHSIRTKPFPAWLEPSRAIAELDDEALSAVVEGSVEGFAREYQAYFDEHSAQGPATVTRLDSMPRIVAARELGICAAAPSRAQARVVADLYEHAAGVMMQAQQIGRFEPVTRAQLFDVEYWSLEQAKLGKAGAQAPFAGRVALITGAASGIGLATARRFLELGAHALLVDRDGDALEAAAAELGKPDRLELRVADLTDESAAANAVDETVLCFGGLDVVVSNAGDAPRGALHEAGGSDRLRASLELNLSSHQYVAAAAARTLIRQGLGGCLLFNASKSAFNPGPLFGPYAVAKSGLVALMKQYAIDLASAGVRSNAVNADRVRTGLFSPEMVAARARARGTTPDAYFRSNLLGRETTARDVADAFAHLALAEATTGAVVPVDGGNPAAFPR